MRRTILLVSVFAFLLPACGSDSEPMGVPGASASTPTASPIPPGARAITLLSGEDPLPTYTIENGKYAGETGEVVWAQDYCGGGYAEIEGTLWVGVESACRKSHASARRPFGRGVYTNYDLTFRLPRGFASPSISVLVLADDAAEIILNGTSIGAQPTGDDDPAIWQGNFAEDPWPFTSEKASAFRSGVNTLRFRVVDIGGNTGVDYSATITYFPKKESG